MAMTFPCVDMEVLLHGPLDGELDAAHAFRVEDYLRICPACAGEYQRLMELRPAVREDTLHYPEPDALRADLGMTRACPDRSACART